MVLSKVHVNKIGELVYISGGLETNIKGIRMLEFTEATWWFYIKAN